MSGYIQVATSVETYEGGQKLAEILLQKRLAACIQIIGPMTSHYWWQGKIEKSSEHLLLIKSKRNLYDELEKSIKENHPYDVAEILAMPVLTGNSDYLNWLNEELG